MITGANGESNPDLRLLAERIDRNHAETTAHINRLEARVEAIPAAMDRYVRMDVYEARERARDAADSARDAAIKRMDEADKTDRASGRSWLQGVGLAFVGAACGVLSQFLTAKGGK